MTKKTFVIILSILCLTVWSLVIFQLVMYSPAYSYENAPYHLSRMEQKSSQNVEGKNMSSVLEHEYSSTLDQKKIEVIDEEDMERIRIEGLTEEEMLDIAIGKQASIDTLLYVLNIDS